MSAQSRRRSVWRFRSARAAAGFLVLVALAAIFRSVLANEAPVVAIEDGRVAFPALQSGPGSAPPKGFALYPPVRHGPDSIDLSSRLQPPERGHLLGTDDLGRDVAARMIHGSAVSLTVGVVATVIALLVGVVLGSLAGYYGGAVDWVVSRLIEVVLCFPFLFLLLAIVALFEPSMYTVIIALGLTSWTGEARFIRAEFLKVRELEFTEAARAIGARDARIIVHHILPNAIAPVLVSASFGVGSAILLESALSFLGFGVPLPTASWGSILHSAQSYVAHAWWLVLFPGLAIFLTVAACNTLGDRLRDSMDPRS